ncbi:MAG: 3-deoxy-D-manno-octulosonic acid transferase [Rhodoferax sp.]|uniref:3-deoxy-D-manno-octulosonic acid transferase n=1 Tax=Rhodoferax sp. TaxID=50421 RepID=UPI002620598B|nr:3-deoxy-D-manno-octulosonic acid transferase [Rhodoferax sp.]MDD5335653.1 3-deoxy-D-manno-octulosonic acid transferase [Rhodoferax sp.]
MTRRLYTFLMWLAQPWLRRKLARRGQREPGYLEAMEERFGHYGDKPPAAAGQVVWLHAVSLGETRAAALLVAGLRQRLPGMRLLLTHGTATGRAEGAKLLQAGDIQTWQPWDTPVVVARFLDHFKPRIGILMETEIWPNLVAACARSALPLVLANARLSEQSMRKARRLAWLAAPAYRGLTAVWAQTPDDALRLSALGAKVQGVFGNLKFDAAPDAELLARGRAWRQRAGRPVVMFASSREGEEAALLRLLSAASGPGQGESRSVASEVQWLIVPRHPQRFDEVAALIAQHGFALSRRSLWRDAPPAMPGAGERRRCIWLGDSLGEMALYYGLADVALLGGSFEPLGGQNLIEAAACGCPVVMGPHTFNFVEAAELAAASGAAVRVENMAQALDAVSILVGNAAPLQAARRAADAFAGSNRGATERTLTAIKELLAAW